VSGDAQVSYDLAWSYYSLGRINEAELAMQTTTRSAGFKRSEDANRFLRMVAASKEPSQAQQNVREAEKILSAEPAYAPALMVLGLDREQQGDYAKAADTYQRILEQRAGFTPAA